MEDIYRIDPYLPLFYADKSELEYVKTLLTALELSYDNKLYQFAYIQLHMVFMVCIYYALLKLNTVMPKELENALYYMLKRKGELKKFYKEENTKDKKLYFGSFAIIGESDVFRLLKLINIDSDFQSDLIKLVEERNKYAHANGNLTITEQNTIDTKFENYLTMLERVSKLMKPVIENFYKITLNDVDFYNTENRGYFDNNEQIKEEFIRKNLLTKKDVSICKKFNIASLQDMDGYADKKALHIALCEYYKTISDD